jgi:hypothetical protein
MQPKCLGLQAATAEEATALDCLVNTQHLHKALMVVTYLIRYSAHNRHAE